MLAPQLSTRCKVTFPRIYALCGKEHGLFLDYLLKSSKGRTLYIYIFTYVYRNAIGMQVRDFMTVETLKPHVDFFYEKSSIKHIHGHPKYAAYSIDVMNICFLWCFYANIVFSNTRVRLDHVAKPVNVGSSSRRSLPRNGACTHG